MNFSRNRARDLERFFGPLEIRVLEALWRGTGCKAFAICSPISPASPTRR